MIVDENSLEVHLTQLVEACLSYYTQFKASPFSGSDHNVCSEVVVDEINLSSRTLLLLGLLG